MIADENFNKKGAALVEYSVSIQQRGGAEHSVCATFDMTAIQVSKRDAGKI